VSSTTAGGELMGMVGVMVVVRRRGRFRWRQSFWKNVRTQRTLRAKPVGRWGIGIIVSKAWPAYRVCEGTGILPAEGNAATVARPGDGRCREGDGHGIWIQIVCT
jgi:hypothetical protein